MFPPFWENYQPGTYLGGFGFDMGYGQSVAVQMQQAGYNPYAAFCKHGSGCPVCAEDNKRQQQIKAEADRLEAARQAEYKERCNAFMKHYREKYGRP